MNFPLIFFLFLVGFMPNLAYALGPRAQMISTRAPRAHAISVNIQRNDTVTNGTSSYQAVTHGTSTAYGITHGASTDPLVTIINTSQTDLAYRVEKGVDSEPTAFATCPAPCILVPAGETVRFFPGYGFNGALTATGSRHELNFFSSPGETWYDISMELGMSHETLGPSDHRPQADGRSSLSGESDLLAEANAAWHLTSAAEQEELLASEYFTGTVGGDLTAVHMDSEAPILVRHWYQLEAELDAYMVPGSVAGKQHLHEADKLADTKVSHVLTNKMTITIY